VTPDVPLDGGSINRPQLGRLPNSEQGHELVASPLPHRQRREQWREGAAGRDGLGDWTGSRKPMLGSGSAPATNTKNH